MFELDSLAKWLIALGLGVAAFGLLLFLLGQIPGTDRLGRLPGDLRFELADGRISCFVPIVSSILLSIILTIVLNVIIRLFNR
ncbi:MAG TPA: DUF2905 domain-containing protein [Aggregatilineales bacterium]|nr:DUF2905 domain-containing protein [Chloroflexota bacterium]HOA24187.1 DUF2905 domain-containing protein [Aggregatilineales bacterium]HPV07713.1 DUF2905 domain-containing protein [Aggregatilineales bacterium]HQA67492.1 DUF2905 domain-containing protein [Aggregatilineales bacterium]HQE17062.1 DUF2905 domain-containing protein [Aggregatilineales bacterium]